MRIIQQSHQFINGSDHLKLIESAGRTCYKSEDKITEDSAHRFVKMITKAGHYSVLEHASICFEIHQEKAWEFIINADRKYLFWDGSRVRKLVSGNFRAWLEFIQFVGIREAPDEIINIFMYLHKEWPEIFPIPFDCYHYMEIPTVVPENQMTIEEKLIHATRTCRFITNRGVTHELVRHRTFSFSQESTRYVKYDGGMEFILPVWFGSVWEGTWFDREGAWKSRFGRSDEDWMIAPATWLFACEQAENMYHDLLKEDWKPEQAREILPNSLKTEIVCTAPLNQWKHMLGLRTSKAAHPQIRGLMEPVLIELQEEFPDIFKSIGGEGLGNERQDIYKEKM